MLEDICERSNPRSRTTSSASLFGWGTGRAEASTGHANGASSTTTLSSLQRHLCFGGVRGGEPQI